MSMSCSSNEGLSYKGLECQKVYTAAGGGGGGGGGVGGGRV